jgi:hypothetical protein
MLPRAAVLGLVLALAGCTERILLSDLWDAAGPDVASNKDVGTPVSADGCGLKYVPLTYWPRSAQVLILFERSVAMQSSLGSTTREAAAESALMSAIGNYQAKVKFGFEQFPPDSSDKAIADCQDDSCCAGSVIVEPMSNAYRSIYDPLKCADSSSAPCPTPSYESTLSAALVQARDHPAWAKKYLSATEDRYALLVVASEPGCSPPGDSREPCASARSTATDLSNLRVRLVVLSVGFQPAANSCLDHISETGSQVLPPASMSTLYTPTSVSSLSKDVNDFASAVAQTACTLNLDVNNTPPPAQAQVQMYMGMSSITQSDPNGWTFADASRSSITLSGWACDQFSTSQLSQLSGGYYCSTCSGSTPCPW